MYVAQLLRLMYLSYLPMNYFQINLKRIGDLEIFARNFKIGWTKFLKKRRREEEQMEECKRAEFFVRLDYFIVELL